MHIYLFAAPALLFACAAAAQGDGRSTPLEAGTKVPPLQYRSAFDDYRPFADQELADWRKANDEVGTAGGHMGHRPGQFSGQATPKPAAADKGAKAPPRQGHGSHK